MNFITEQEMPASATRCFLPDQKNGIYGQKHGGRIVALTLTSYKSLME